MSTAQDNMSPRQPEGVARLSQMREGGSRLVRVNDVEIALWLVAGRIFAIHNVCPHQHFSSLHEGTLDGVCVTCPRHGWSFSLEDGRARSGSGRAAVYPVRVVGDQIYVDLPSAAGQS